MDKRDLPPQPVPESDADLYEGRQLPDPTSVEEYIGPDNWSKDISQVENKPKRKKKK